MARQQATQCAFDTSVYSSLKTTVKSKTKQRFMGVQVSKNYARITTWSPLTGMSIGGQMEAVFFVSVSSTGFIFSEVVSAQKKRLTFTLVKY